MNEKRERGMGSLYQRGATWWAAYYHHGAKVRVSCETTDEKKAAKFLKRKLAEVETNTHTDTHTLRYEDLRESYYADYLTNRRKSLRRDGEGNPRLDKVIRLDSFFEGWRANEITTDAIRKFQAGEQARGLSNGTVNRSVSALRRMFSLARKERRLRDVPYFPMLKESAPREGFLEIAGYETLSRTLPAYMRLPLALGFFTGMREGEVLALEWKQVDLLSNVIRLRAGETKNDEARAIPVVPQLRGLLIEARAARQTKCPYVCFRLDRRGQAVRIGSFRKAWQTACGKAGLGKMVPTGEAAIRADRPQGRAKVKTVYEGLIFHDLRRSAVRNLVRSGVPEKVAMQITGHKTRSVFDRYNIVSENDLTQAGRQLATFLENGHNSGTVCTEMQQASSAVN